MLLRGVEKSIISFDTNYSCTFQLKNKLLCKKILTNNKL